LSVGDTHPNRLTQQIRNRSVLTKWPGLTSADPSLLMSGIHGSSTRNMLNAFHYIGHSTGALAATNAAHLPPVHSGVHCLRVGGHVMTSPVSGGAGFQRASSDIILISEFRRGFRVFLGGRLQVVQQREFSSRTDCMLSWRGPHWEGASKVNNFRARISSLIFIIRQLLAPCSLSYVDDR